MLAFRVLARHIEAEQLQKINLKLVHGKDPAKQESYWSNIDG